MRLILIGPPGSGKGTQAKLLSQRLHLTHIGTGDLLREAVRLGTPAGKKVEPYVTSGQLATLSGVSQRQVRLWADLALIPSFRIGGQRIRVPNRQNWRPVCAVPGIVEDEGPDADDV